MMSNKRTIFTALIFFAGMGVFASGSNDPALQVITITPDTRQIEIDWSKASSTNNVQFGLYRANREEKSISLVSQISPSITQVVDSNLLPPLSKYFYFIQRVEQGRSLDPRSVFSDGRTIPEREMAAQLASAAYIQSGITLESEGVFSRETGLPVTGESGYGPPYGYSLDTPAAGVNQLPAQPAVQAQSFQYPQDYGMQPQSYTSQPFTAPQQSRKLTDGIYIGFAFFSNKVEAPMSLIPLDPAGRKEIMERLKTSYIPARSHGTALYYAEHTILENLGALEKAGALPANLDSVNIITFTDGLDTASTDVALRPPGSGTLSFAGKQTGSYMNYINQQLKSRRIGGKRLDAWAIGIPGQDVSSSIDFNQTLESVSSSPDRIVQLGNISQIEYQLSSIADRLTNTTPVVNLSFTLPAYPAGTIVRITFDNYSWPEGAVRYIEGRVSYANNANNTYTLTALSGYGINLATRNITEGKRTDYGIEYTVTINDSFDETSLRQWYKHPSPYNSGEWLLNSEFQTRKVSDFTSSRKSAIIYLALDCSSSLSDMQINEVREAVSRFIERLYTTASYSNNDVPLIAGNYEATQIQINPSSWEAPVEIPAAAVLPKIVEKQNPASVTIRTQHYEPPYQTQIPVQIQTQAPVPQVQYQIPAPQSPVVQFQAPPPQYQTPKINQSAPAYVYQPETRSPLPAAAYVDVYEQRYPAYTLPPSVTMPAVTAPPIITAPPQPVFSSAAPVFIQTAPPVQTPAAPVLFMPAPTIKMDEPYSGFWVQVGSYNDIQYAQDSWRKLFLSNCKNTEIFGKMLNGIMYYRVKIGPYQDRRDAEYALQVIRQANIGFNDAYIIRQ